MVSNASEHDDPRLIVVSPAEMAGTVLRLAVPQSLIGHSDSADVIIPDGFVSRRHAVVTADPAGQVMITDLNSTGGTFVNGERLTGPRVLADGDEVRFADLVARFEPGGPVAVPGGSPTAPTLSLSVLGAAGAGTVRAITGEEQTVKAVTRDFALGVVTFGLMKGATAGVGSIRSAVGRAVAAGAEGGSEAAASRIGTIVREDGPAGSGKAVATAEVEVPGYKGRSPVLRARSGPATPDPSLQNVPHSPVPEKPVLTTSKVSNAPGEHAGSRATDAEIKVLNEVQKGACPSRSNWICAPRSKQAAMSQLHFGSL